MVIKWEKPYRGPFKKLEATQLAESLRIKADPEKNGIIKEAIRKRPHKKKELYDVYIKTDI